MVDKDDDKNELLTTLRDLHGKLQTARQAQLAAARRNDVVDTAAEALDWARVLVDKNAELRTHLREANALLEIALEADPSEHVFGQNFTARIRAHLDEQSKVDCAHQHTERGKDLPLLHGSYLSEVCTVCGAFRALSHLPPHDPIQGRRGRWRPQSEYEAATKEDDER